MGRRMVLASFLGGLVIFVWGFVSHMLLPLGQHGLKPLPAAEAQMASALKAAAPSEGIYLVPAIDWNRMNDETYKTDAEARLRAGPYGFLVVQPGGTEPMTPATLMRELATNIGMAFLATFLIVAAGGFSGHLARIVFCVMLVLFGFLQTDVRLWNWYKFPADFTLAQFADKLIGGVLLGIVVTAILKRR